MRNPPRRWFQFSLATLLCLMTLSAFLARPAWRQWQRWGPQVADWRFWRLAREPNADAHVRRGLEWLKAHQSESDQWEIPSTAGQTQESDLSVPSVSSQSLIPSP